MPTIERKPAHNPAALRRLGAAEMDLLREHLLRLDPQTRRQRFGVAVNDDFIGRYAATATNRDATIEGAFVDGVMRGAGELRSMPGERPTQAEAAFSIEREFQGRGIGRALVERIIVLARNRGIRDLHVICLSENARMRRLAARHGAGLTFLDGQIDGRVDLPAADTSSRAKEWLWGAMALAAAAFDAGGGMLNAQCVSA